MKLLCLILFLIYCIVCYSYENEDVLIIPVALLKASKFKSMKLNYFFNHN